MIGRAIKIGVGVLIAAITGLLVHLTWSRGDVLTYCDTRTEMCL